ncbi:hypothetical protein E2C01_014945 [Portunus trituberculatus]|uniref:Uncharacterized protein n=1 Tax=Portunus trituberculatus TaxID=210409 RepID=A0A5B7DKD7_PORTR|nr:hypothetical protein [Portunus trituberculatus]
MKTSSEQQNTMCETEGVVVVVMVVVVMVVVSRVTGTNQFPYSNHITLNVMKEGVQLLKTQLLHIPKIRRLRKKNKTIVEMPVPVEYGQKTIIQSSRCCSS